MLAQFKGFLDNAKKTAEQAAKNAQRDFEKGQMGGLEGDKRNTGSKAGLNPGQGSTYGSIKPGASNTKS